MSASRSTPTTLAARLRPHFLDRLPEAERAVGNRELGGGKADIPVSTRRVIPDIAARLRDDLVGRREHNLLVTALEPKRSTSTSRVAAAPTGRRATKGPSARRRWQPSTNGWLAGMTLGWDDPGQHLRPRTSYL